MTEDAVRVALRSAVREAFRLGGEKYAGQTRRDAALANATEYGEQLVVHVAQSWADQAREQGWQAGRAGAATHRVPA